MTSKDKLNFIANCVDSSKCDLMQIDIYRKEIECDLILIEWIKKYSGDKFKEVIANGKEK